MTMFNHLSTFADCAMKVTPDTGVRFAVTLIDRRKGKPHHISGVPLTLMTSDPEAASEDLLRNRDPSLWGVIVEKRDRKGRIQ